MKSHSLTKKLCLLFTLVTFGTFIVKAQSTKNVSLNSFNSVGVSAGIQLIITQSNTESARIEANSDNIDEVVLENSGGKLNVKWKKTDGFFSQHKNREAKVYLNYKNLNSVSASSGSLLKSTNALKADRLSVDVSSGANLNLQLTCNNLEVNTSSGSNAKLSGSAKNIIVDSSSGSTVSALDTNTEYAKTEASSGANIKISVSKGIEASASSGGNISYKGDAALNKKGSSRSGSVSKIG
ncbi:head GIN domain-containing protein [Pedobacter antarcticus]|uniref:head GIN domain-containing protein n=1 Tax=Pedobacter antarcticus TaxID=34086 RepID=UPI001C59A1BB|nr:DUF2807 domain-containing protein [Pedobacter antarcticus]